MSPENKIFEDFCKSKVESFYKNIYPGLLLYAIRWLGKEHSFLAEDCVQNAVFNAWERRNNFSSASALKSYLYTCIKNNIIDIHRKSKSGNKYISSLDDQLVFTNSIIEQETLNILFKAISTLPDKYRVVLEMNFIEGLKIKEISNALNLSESTIEKRKYKALDMLRDILTNIYGDTIYVTILLLALLSRLR
jgi:RNA polymerase sigma-70 factor (ECF subfamily)